MVSGNKKSVTTKLKNRKGEVKKYDETKLLPHTSRVVFLNLHLNSESEGIWTPLKEPSH